MMELLTVAETAALLKTTKQQVRKMIAQRLIPALKVGREWRIDRNYLESFLRSEMEYVLNTLFPKSICIRASFVI